MSDIQFFRENGYVIIKNYFTSEEASKIVEFADEIEKWDEAIGKWMIFFEKNKKKSRIEHYIY